MSWTTDYRYAFAAVAILSGAQPGHAQAPVRRTLENGARIIVAPIPGVGRVGVESFYGVGFVHEPEALTQAAHLIEHLVCMGATANSAPGETYAQLNEAGMANAETLADFTHYDAMIPADRLGEVLRAEAARLASLRIDAAIVAQEAPRCYQEAVSVEGVPQAPLFKFALMAAHQSWRYRSETALIKGGLVETPIDRLQAFHAAYYTPSNLTLVIAGDVVAEEVIRLAQDTIGRLPRRDPPTLAPIDRAALPRDATVRWDSTAAALLVTYDPPADDTERLAVTLLGMLRAEALHSDATLARDSRFTIGTSNIYPAGDLPFFVYATLVEGAAEGAAERIDARARELLLREPTVTELAQLRGYLTQLRTPFLPSAPTARTQAKQFAPRIGGDEDRAMGMVVGQVALTLGMNDRLISRRETAAAGVSKMSPTELRHILERTLTPDRRVITRLVPATP